jgi:hypothetical protein
VATTPLINVESQRVEETHTQKFFVVVSTTLDPPKMAKRIAGVVGGMESDQELKMTAKNKNKNKSLQ